MAVNIGPKIGIDGEAKFRSEIKNITQQMKTLKAEMGETESAFGKNTTAMEKARAKSQNLTSQIETQKTRVEQLNQMVEASAEKYGDADTKTLKWKEALAQANTELNNMETELKQIPWDTVTQIGEGMTAAGQKISSAGQTLTRNVTAPIVGVAAAGVKYIADFDTSMSKVQALAGDVSQDVSDAVVAMAQETGKQFEITGDSTVDAYNAMEVIARQQAEVTKYTAGETAEAMTYMALAGWDVEQMASGLPGILNLAAASGMDLSSASDIVTDQLTAFGYAAEDSAHFADVLATTQARSNTTTADMGEALKYAGPVAGALGYSIEDVSIALGLMANSGIKASTAGTTLRTLLQNMANPTNTMAAAMETLGVSLEDGEGNMLTFQQVMDDLRAGFGDLRMPLEDFQSAVNSLDQQLADGSITEEEYNVSMEELTRQAFGAEGALKAQAAAQLAGTRGMSGLLAIVNTGADDYQSLTDAIYDADGAAEDMALTMQDNLSGKLEILKSKLGETAFQFLDGLMPVLESAVESIQGLVDSFNNLDDEQKQNILRIVGVVAAIGPVLSIIGTVITAVGTVTTTIGTVGAAITAAGGLIPAITAALAAAAPVIGVIIAVVAAVAAVILIIKHWGEITEWLSATWETVKTSISNAVTLVQLKITAAWNDIKEATTNAWDAVKTFITDTWNKLKTTVQNAITTVQLKITAAWNKVKTTTTTIWNNIKTAITTAWNNIKTAVTNAINSVKTTITTVFDSIKTTISNVWNTITTTISTAVNNVWTTITTGLTNAWTSVTTIFTGIWTSISTALTGAWTTVSTTVTGIWTTISTALTGAWSSVTSIFSSIYNAIYDKIWGAYNTVSSAISWIKGLFNFEWSLPSIKLPHFSWSWIDLGGIVSIPSISVSWYKRAYTDPMLFTSPTVLGTAGGMKGFGDGRGGEVVIGQQMMYAMIRDAVAEGGGTSNTWGDINVVVNGAEGQDVRELADLVADRIAERVQRRRAAFA